MNARRRLILSLIALLLVFVVGSAGYMALAGATADEAAFMTLVTLSTVGFREVVQLDGPARLWTAALIVLGIAVVSVAFTSMVTVFVGSEIRSVLGRRKVQQKIDRLKGHTILCGFGRMGALAARKIASRGVEVVVVEHSSDQVPDLEAAGLLHVIGDATEEETLQSAGLAQADALVTALPTDADNVFVTLTARGLRPDLTIVARAEQPRTQVKLERAGANRVICPQLIGATRIADILTRPHVVDFFEVAAQGVELELDEYRVEAKSALCDRTLREAVLLQGTGAIVVAIKRRDGSSVYQPGQDEMIREGDRLILIGRSGTSTRLDEVGRAST